MSTDHQRYSIENQADAIAEYAELNGFHIVQTYADEGRSGLNAVGRKALLQMVDDVRDNPAFEAILVYDVSRWGRFQDTDESAHYEYVCRSAGIPVHYCAEQFTNNGSLGDALLKTLKRAMAGEYSRELSEKVYKGQCRLVRLGYRQGGPTAYGLRRLMVDAANLPKTRMKAGERKSFITDRVILIPGPANEIAVVNCVFHLIVNYRLSPQSIASLLNSLRVPAGGGGLWTRSIVARMATNESYIGNNVFGRTSFKLQRVRVSKCPAEWIRADGVYEPIVSKDLFYKAQVVVAYNTRINHPRKRSRRSLPSFHYRRLADADAAAINAMVVDATGIAPVIRMRSNGFRFYRVDNKSAGWMVRVTINGTSSTEYFADSAYGSRELSRQAAEFSGAHDRELHAELRSIRARLCVRKNSRSGIPGVTRYESNAKRPAHWLAYWLDAKSRKRVSRRFYVDQYGEEKARELAIETREQMVAASKKRLSELTALVRHSRDMLDSAGGSCESKLALR